MIVLASSYGVPVSWDSLMNIFTGITSNIGAVLPIVGGLVIAILGVKLVPRIISAFTRT